MTTVPQDDQCTLLRNLTFRRGYQPPLENRIDGIRAQTVLFYIENFLFISFVLVMFFFKRLHPSRARFSRLQHRSVTLVLITHLGASFVTVIGSWYQSHPLESGLPCWMFLTAYFLMVPFLILPLSGRLLAFYREAQWTAVVMKRAAIPSAAPAIQQHNNDDEDDTNDGTQGAGFWHRVLLSMIFCCRGIRFPRKQASSAVVSTEEKTLSNKQVDIQVVKFLKSKFGSYLTLLIIATPYFLTAFIVLGVNPLVRAGCVGCSPSRTEEILLIVESVWALILIISSYRMVLNRKDPFGIVNEVRLAVWLGGVPAVICQIMNSTVKAYTQADFQFVMPVELFIVIYCFCQSGLQCILAVVDVKRESSAMMRSAFTLKEFEREFLRKDGPFHVAFEKHLASEHGYESMAFLLGVFQWEKEFFDVNPKTARARAKKIVKMYVGDQAEQPCNLSEACVKSIAQILARLEEEDLKYDFFAAAKAELTKMLYGDSFRRFIRTREYQAVAANRLQATSNNAGMTTPTPHAGAAAVVSNARESSLGVVSLHSTSRS